MNINKNNSSNSTELNKIDSINQIQLESDNILNQFDEIKKISNEFEKLFFTNEPNNFLFPIIFNYNFKKEIANGFIEYKRTLSTYLMDNKKDKLLRQIYWRIYQGLVTDNVKLCYYIIGLEDSGFPSNSKSGELEVSLGLIKECLSDTNIKYEYLYLKNNIKDYIILVVKFFLDNDFNIDYF